MFEKLTPVAILALTLVAGCSDPTATWPKAVVARGRSASGRLSVELRADSTKLWTGYESLAAILRDKDGNLVSDAHVRWIPLMDMGGHHHSAPVDTIGASADSTGIFRAGIVFVMPSAGRDGAWTLHLRIHDHKANGGAAQDSVDLPLHVEKPESPRLISFKAADGSPRWATVAQPQAPKSDLNTLDIFIARKDTGGFSWPADDSWGVEFKPSMPEMGHGSSGNVQPVGKGRGHYVGKVNFSMGGTWRLDFKFKHNGTAFVDTGRSLELDVAD